MGLHLGRLQFHYTDLIANILQYDHECNSEIRALCFYLYFVM
jgi:hypothetical protein